MSAIRQMVTVVRRVQILREVFPVLVIPHTDWVLMARHVMVHFYYTILKLKCYNI